MEKSTAEVLRDVCTPLTNRDEGNITDALFEAAQAGENIASAIHRLGNADASTPMGAIEALGAVMERGFDSIADAIRSGLEQIADAIGEKA